MMIHTKTLRYLASELFTEYEQRRLGELHQAYPPNLNILLDFDNSLHGPSIVRMYCKNEGRYEIADRSIFRPLQYCGVYFRRGVSKEWDADFLWLMRDVVEMSSLHIEGLVKKIGNVFHFPLGKALRNIIVKTKLDPITWRQIDTYTGIYNDAKHNFSHDKDTHMFSVEDPLLSYFICRKLGVKLYPLANLATDIKIFDKECSQVIEIHDEQPI
jgi:hypothetical protein